MKKGGWVEGFYMCSVDGETHFIANYPNAKMSMPVLDIIYPESLCLFSGCFDKYGRKIFDNDCVTIEKKVYKVVFESAAFMLEKINKDSEPYMYFLCDMPEKSIELIGNALDTLD
jgi:hypothetical protein